MARILESDSTFMLWLSRIFDVLIVSLFFIICCVPVITIGPALTALYYTTKKVVIKREGYVTRVFFGCMKQNFVQGLVSWLIVLLISVIMGLNIFFVANTWKGALAISLIAVYFMITVVTVVMTAYMFPILSQFECTVKQLITSSISMSVTYPFRTIVLLMAQLVFYFLLVYFFSGMPVFLFVLPVVHAIIQGKLLEPVFDKARAEIENEEFGETAEEKLEDVESDEADEEQLEDVELDETRECSENEE